MRGMAAGGSGTWARQALIVLAALLAAWGLGWSAWRIATEGPGVLGVNNDVPWGWDVVNFVFWIGLGHAGTLISAVLLLTRQRWRSGIARHAELMTLCSLAVAAVFPLAHVGRIWMLWALSPLPIASGVWPDMASPLVWDAAAIGSYFLLSTLYWLIGMLGERRELAEAQRASWARACILLAALLTPLVVTVHSVVGSDFAVALRWHAPFLPAYFVCGALLSGMACVQLIALARRGSAELIERLARLTLGLAMAMGLFYALECAQSGFSTPPGPTYAAMLALNVALPALYWFPRLRRSRTAACLISFGVLAGMWLERVHIIIGRSIAATGGGYSPSGVDVAMLLGSVGLFLALFLAISPRMPAEEHEPLDTYESARPGQGRAAFAGAALGLAAALPWAWLTQYAETAGALAATEGRPLFFIPALLVAALLGAGLAVSLNLYLRLRRP